MSSRFARAIPALVLVAAIGAGCSSSSNNSVVPQPVAGPNFSYGFPAAGNPPPAAPGTSNKRIFTEVGSWVYRCIPHGPAGMTGTVIVDTSAALDSAAVEVGAVGPNPGGLNFACSFCDTIGSKTVTIKPGGYVRWYNVSSTLVHTVTRP
jgi:plastocyanin